MSKKATLLTDEGIILQHAQPCRRRARVELAIVHKVIKELRAAGYKLSVDDGGDTSSGDEQELVNAIFAVDESHLTTSMDGKRKSFVLFVRGNDGPDVICDYGLSLELVMEPISNWIDVQVELGIF